MPLNPHVFVFGPRAPLDERDRIMLFTMRRSQIPAFLMRAEGTFSLDRRVQQVVEERFRLLLSELRSER
jgi:hypothetical protein